MPAGTVAPVSTRGTVSSLVLAGKPALAVDVGADGSTGPLSEATDPVPWSFLAHGLKLLPGFLGVAMPDDTRLRLVLRAGRVTLVTPGGAEVLAVAVDDLPDGWLDAVGEHGGVLVFVGRDLDLVGAEDAPEVGAALHAAAVAGRVVGGIVELDLLAGG